VVVAGLVVTDSIALVAGLGFAYLARIIVTPEGDLLRAVPVLRYGVLLLIALLWLALLWSQGLYRRANLFSGIDEYRRILFASGASVLLVVAASYFWRGPVISRGFTALSLLAIAMFLCTGRFMVRRLIYRLSARGHKVMRAIIVGANRDAVAIARQLGESRSATTEVAGFLSEYAPVGSEPLPGVRVLADPLQLVEVSARVDAGIAVVVESALSWESLHYVVRMMHMRGGPEVVLVPSLYDLHATAMSPQQLGPILALAPRPARITGFDAFLKRSLDIVVGGTALLLSLPLILVQTIHSAFGAQRMGLVREPFVDGRGTYYLWRFSYPAWAARAHVSRLPSLVQVVRGRTSLLGPRPIRLGREAEYAEAKPLLESAKPGFIGPWWLVGRGRPASLEEELTYDLHYLRNYTIWFDLQILVHALRGLRTAMTREVYPGGPGARDKEPSARSVEGAATSDSL
jgi:lipopolysaccharide/colanic/teichoic acid biosynthesis glycosyltransferase